MTRRATSGIITLMGSGELTATMVEVHKDLLGRYGGNGRAAFIDTPAGFQLNVDHLSSRAADYFRDRVRHPLSIASLKSVQTAAEPQIAQTYRLLREADYVLIGPGSPTYALDQWRRTRIPEILTECVRAGGCLVAASAAALTVGRFTLPVYEIYKVGHDPHWVEGLDLLQAFGFNWAVMPHWNNAEGGNHDTRYCFMGQPRLQVLEALLPEDTGILGLDEHTALVIDLARPEAVIKGIGRITLRRGGREWVFDKHDRIPLSLLRAGPDEDMPQSSAPRQAIRPDTEIAGVVADPVWDPLPEMREKIQELLDEGRDEPAAGLVLEMERHIWDRQEQLQERGAMGAAREILRDMIALIGARLNQRPADRKTCLAPVVESLLAVRARLRKQQQWAAADAVRDGLQAAGVTVRDTAGGHAWDLAE